MRGLNVRLTSSSMALVTESVDLVTTAKQILNRVRMKCRHSLCAVLHGGHELYRARTDTKLYQQCLLCGYETQGWTIDRRDRRLHDESGYAALIVFPLMVLGFLLFCLGVLVGSVIARWLAS